MRILSLLYCIIILQCTVKKTTNSLTVFTNVHQIVKQKIRNLISCFRPNALVYYIFSYSSTCFEPYCAHHQEDSLYTYSIWFFMCHSSCVTVRCTGSYRTLTACAPNGHTIRVTHKEPDAVYIQ